jgi:hypothetical protein
VGKRESLTRMLWPLSAFFQRWILSTIERLLNALHLLSPEATGFFFATPHRIPVKSCEVVVPSPFILPCPRSSLRGGREPSRRRPGRRGGRARGEGGAESGRRKCEAKRRTRACQGKFFPAAAKSIKPMSERMARVEINRSDTSRVGGKFALSDHEVQCGRDTSGLCGTPMYVAGRLSGAGGRRRRGGARDK